MGLLPPRGRAQPRTPITVQRARVIIIIIFHDITGVASKALAILFYSKPKCARGMNPSSR